MVLKVTNHVPPIRCKFRLFLFRILYIYSFIHKNLSTFVKNIHLFSAFLWIICIQIHLTMNNIHDIIHLSNKTCLQGDSL